MKNKSFIASLALLVVLMAAGCKKTDVAMPSGLSINPGRALPGTFITITGTDIQDITSIKFDTATATISSVFNTDKALFTNVPDNARYGPQVVTLTNRAGNKATVNFTVIQPAPTITSFAPGGGAIGDTITITGTTMQNITSLTLGGVPCIIIDSSTTTRLRFKIPTGAVTGLLTLVTAGGTATSVSLLNVGERALLIADFDGGGIRPDGASWYSYAGAPGTMTKTITNTNPAPTSGNFLKAVGGSGGNYAGLSTYTVGGNEQFGLSGAVASNSFIKFSVNNNGYTNTQIQVIVQVGTTGAAADNYAATVVVNGNGWNTMSVRISDMLNNYGSGPLTPTPSAITSLKFHFNQSAAGEMDIDNVRIAY